MLRPEPNTRQVEHAGYDFLLTANPGGGGDSSGSSYRSSSYDSYDSYSSYDSDIYGSSNKKSSGSYGSSYGSSYYGSRRRSAADDDAAGWGWDGGDEDDEDDEDEEFDAFIGSAPAPSEVTASARAHGAGVGSLVVGASAAGGEVSRAPPAAEPEGILSSTLGLLGLSAKELEPTVVVGLGDGLSELDELLGPWGGHNAHTLTPPLRHPPPPPPPPTTTRTTTTMDMDDVLTVSDYHDATPPPPPKTAAGQAGGSRRRDNAPLPRSRLQGMPLSHPAAAGAGGAYAVGAVCRAAWTRVTLDRF
jgi:hypothetical protein